VATEGRTTRSYLRSNLKVKKSWRHEHLPRKRNALSLNFSTSPHPHPKKGKEKVCIIWKVQKALDQ
jgi:hypothetical protein